MTIRERLRKLAGMKGFHYLFTRFGGRAGRAVAFDEIYRKGKWDTFDRTVAPELVAAVEKYANAGAILSLGCGPGSLVPALQPDSYSRFVGIDVSPEALRRAECHASEKVRFELGEIESVEFDQRFDLMLFEESLNYVAAGDRLATLRRYAANLTDDGVILVTLAEAQRYRQVVELIRANFDVIEDDTFPGSERKLLVFRG